jgi:hypothetical protein
VKPPKKRLSDVGMNPVFPTQIQMATGNTGTSSRSIQKSPKKSKNGEI